MKNTLLILLLLLVVSVNCYPQKQGKKSSASKANDETLVRAILKKIDADVSDTSVYSNDVVHMAQGSRAITRKTELAKVLKAEASYGKTVMTHEVISLNSYDDIVLVRGRVKGMFHPNDGGAASTFETNNMMTFKRQPNGSLKIWQVIFNRINLDNEQTLWSWIEHRMYL